MRHLPFPFEKLRWIVAVGNQFHQMEQEQQQMAFASFLVQQPKVWMKVKSWYFRLQKYKKSPTVLIMLPVPSMAKFTCPLWMDCLLNVSLKKLFCFSFEFSENWQSCSYICVLKLHQVSLYLNEKHNSVFNDTFNKRSVR